VRNSPRNSSTHVLLLPVACLLLASSPPAHAQPAPATLALANAALQAGEADKALALLNSLPATGPGAAQAQSLLCRVHFALADWDAAVKDCQQAVRLDSQNSVDHMWLGRALGQKAGHAPFFSAFSLGKRVRSEFEQAVLLDPHNAPALTDLGDFYADAPAVVGGGADKAQSIANQLDQFDPPRAHELRARLAESHQDFAAAERELRQAISLSPHPASQWTVLAAFFLRRRRWSDLDAAIHNCVAAAARDKHSGVALYDGAGVLIESDRQPALAAKMLEDYLASPFKTEEGPAFIAHIRLGRLKLKLGDSAGAKREFAAASALAHEYNPAQDSAH